MTFEELQKANSTIKTMQIKRWDKKQGIEIVKEYAEVNERVKAFRMLYPNGTISTDIVSLADGVCVIKAVIMSEAGCILATGHAYEKEGSSIINQTSYIENAETSAIGRALGMLGIGIDTSIASYEEVANAIEQQNQPEQPPKKQAKKAPAKKQEQTDPDYEEKKQAYQALIAFCKGNNLDINQIASTCKLTKASTKEDFDNALEYAGTLLMMGGNG